MYVHSLSLKLLQKSQFENLSFSQKALKLESFGITGSIHHWLRKFLTKRYMQVVVDGESSNKVTVDSGVTQGTVLGPPPHTS